LFHIICIFPKPFEPCIGTSFERVTNNHFGAIKLIYAKKQWALSFIEPKQRNLFGKNWIEPINKTVIGIFGMDVKKRGMGRIKRVKGTALIHYIPDRWQAIT
jgi:hypothetical protein